MRNQIEIVMGNKPSVAELKNSLDNQYKVLLRNKFATRFFASVACACALLCIDHSVKHNECMDKYNTLLQNYKQTSQFINVQLVDAYTEYQKSCLDEWYEYSDVHSDEYAERVRLRQLNDEDRYTQKLYEKSLTQEDRDEIRDNEKEAEHASDVSKCGFAGGVLLSAISGMGILGCNYKLTDIDMDDDRELGD